MLSCPVWCAFPSFFPSFPIICTFKKTKTNSTFYHFITQFEVLRCFSIYQIWCAYHTISHEFFLFFSCDDAILYDVFF
ncbi:hypothetical protein IMY05_006G0039800 [Salix suchowensis]|nr:hypothetical protein IMY05_006G0039800 [Salix suchowensis]